MKIAIPVTNGRLSSHFGHCEKFAIIYVDTNDKEVKSEQLLTPPLHQPGILPQWLSELSVALVIAGGMGQRAQQLFRQNNIDVIVSAMDNTPQELVKQYLNGQLQYGENICDH